MNNRHLELAKNNIELLWVKGDDFTLEEVASAKKDNRMLLLDMDFSDVCDLHCYYCDRSVDRFNKDVKKQKLTTEERIKLIDQAKELGARTVNFPGAGEPLLDEGFWEVIEHVHKCNMTSIVFTHGYHLNEEVLEKLYKFGASIVIKYNTRDFEKQDKIVGKVGYSARVEEVIKLILKYGFTESCPTRFAIDMIVSKFNNDLDEVKEILRWCRQNNIHIYVSSLIPEGLSDRKSKVLEKQNAEELMQLIQQIDKDEFGLEYEPILPLGGGYRCRKVDVGLFVNLYGEVYDCNGLGRFIGHTRINSLKEIWEAKYSSFIRKEQKDGFCIVRERFWDDTQLSGFERKMADYKEWENQNGKDPIVEEGLKIV